MKNLFLILITLFSSTIYAKQYQRIVSLAPSISQNIYSLNAQDKLIGCTNYCEIAKKEKEIVGSLISLNIEKILSLKPDLVLTTSMMKPEMEQTLKKFNIEVINLHSPKNFEGICKQFLTISNFVGCEPKAAEIINKIRKEIEVIRTKTSKIQKRKFFFQIGAKPLFTVLENTFMDDYISYFNGENIAKGLKHGTISREAVIAKNPDVIIVCTMGLMGKEEQKNWNSYSDLNAVKNNSVVIVKSNIACIPTPQCFLKTMYKLEKLLVK